MNETELFDLLAAHGIYELSVDYLDEGNTGTLVADGPIYVVDADRNAIPLPDAIDETVLDVIARDKAKAAYQEYGRGETCTLVSATVFFEVGEGPEPTITLESSTFVTTAQNVSRVDEKFCHWNWDTPEPFKVFERQVEKRTFKSGNITVSEL